MTAWIGYLNISMNESLGMKISKSFYNFVQEGGYNRLFKTIWISRLHNVTTWSAGHVRHHNPEAAASCERAILSQKIWMLNQAHSLYFLTNGVLYKRSQKNKYNTNSINIEWTIYIGSELYMQYSAWHIYTMSLRHFSRSKTLTAMISLSGMQSALYTVALPPSPTSSYNL